MSSIVLKWLKLKGEVSPCWGGVPIIQWCVSGNLWINFQSTSSGKQEILSFPILVYRMENWTFLWFTEWNLEIFTVYVARNEKRKFFRFTEWKLKFFRFTDWNLESFPVYVKETRIFPEFRIKVSVNRTNSGFNLIRKFPGIPLYGTNFQNVIFFRNNGNPLSDVKS